MRMTAGVLVGNIAAMLAALCLIALPITDAQGAGRLSLKGLPDCS